MSLVLDSLEIKNFRAFKHLRIEKLGRVNLIVGKNNVGKSSLLEALNIYSRSGEVMGLLQLLISRNELTGFDDQRSQGIAASSQERVSALRYLFHGRKGVRGSAEKIIIGPAGSPELTLSVGLEWVPATNQVQSDAGIPPNAIAVSQPITVTVGAVVSDTSITNNLGATTPLLAVSIGSGFHTRYPLNQEVPGLFLTATPAYFGMRHAIAVQSDGLSPRLMSQFWDAVALSDAEMDVLSALRIIAPNVVDLNLIGDVGNNGTRSAKVRVEDVDGPLPLRSLGEGMNRMLGIALALVNAKDGMLLIDEVDTGLHYSVLPDLWKLIFEVAHRLNVQVFATTHSKDCLDAFQYAADENMEEEGVLIRLENRKAGVGAVTFDEEELAIVTRERIEVR